MGILEDFFNKNSNDQEALQLRAYAKLVESINEKQSFFSDNKESIAEYLKTKVNTEEKSIDIPFTAEEFSDIIYSLDERKRHFDDAIDTIEKMFEVIVVDKNSLEQRQYFMKMFKASLKDNFKFASLISFNFPYMLNIFEDKMLFLHLFEYMTSFTYWTHEYRHFLVEYITASRVYYVDETVFFTNIINVINNNKGFLNEKVVASLLAEDKKKAGIYEVSTKEVEELETRLKELLAKVEKVDDNLQTKIDGATKVWQGKFDAINEGITKLEKEYTEQIEQKFASLNKIIIAHNEKSKDSMLHIDGLVNSFQESVKAIKKELDIATSNLLRGEVVKLTEDYKASVEMINELIRNSAGLGDTERNIVNELARKYLMIIGFISDKEIQSTEVSTPGGMNKYFDSSRPLKERLDAVLANKKPGELYHSSIDKIVKEILNNNPVYLVGPSGSCKTYSVKQVAELLGLPLYDFGFVTDEHETFKSYKDVNGKFVKNVFYQAYKTGGICFFDEIDNSESKALVELNRIMGGKDGYEAYLFPNGELVTPHPNLRIVVAGNTYGEGANEAYSTRERLDFGTIDRFSPIRYYYDEVFERQVLIDYPEAYDFAMAYRAALANVNDEYFFTTRRIFKMKKNLDSGCYSIDEIIEDFFVKSLRLDVLENILKNISINRDNEYYIAFDNSVNEKRNNPKTRTRRR